MTFITVFIVLLHEHFFLPIVFTRTPNFTEIFSSAQFSIYNYDLHTGAQAHRHAYKRTWRKYDK